MVMSLTMARDLAADTEIEPKYVHVRSESGGRLAKHVKTEVRFSLP